MIDNELIRIKQVLQRHTLIIVAAIILCFIIGTAVALIFKPKTHEALVKAKEKEAEASRERARASEDYARALVKRIESQEKRDSAILKNDQFIIDQLKINKAKTNEKIKSFNEPHSTDWAVYFSKLPEP